MRAHLYKPVVDTAGNLVSPITVGLYEPGTHTSITDAVYTTDTGTNTLGSTFDVPSGIISVYLDIPRRVRIGVLVAGSPEVFFDDIDVVEPLPSATMVSFTPAGTLVSTNVQAALAEVDHDLSVHLANPTGAHHASAISFVPGGGITSTDVEAALLELDTKKYGTDNPPPAQTRYAVSTAGAGVPSLTGRVVGDLHLNMTDLREYVVANLTDYGTTTFGWVPSDTLPNGLHGQITGDLAYGAPAGSILHVRVTVPTGVTGRGSIFFTRAADGTGLGGASAYIGSPAGTYDDTFTVPAGRIFDSFQIYQGDDATKNATYYPVGHPTRPVGTRLGWQVSDPSYLHDLLVSGPVAVANHVRKPGLRVAVQGILTEATLLCDTAPTGGPITVQVERFIGGVSQGIAATVFIPDGQTSGVTSGLSVQCNKGDVFRFNITAVGTTTPGADLAVGLELH